jgi:hypothetical protein
MKHAYHPRTPPIQALPALSSFGKSTDAHGQHAAYYSVALNSFVHVVMYSYYFLASAIGKDKRKRQRYLWWGAYLTMFQMFQFVTMMLQVCVAITIMTRLVETAHHALSELIHGNLFFVMSMFKAKSTIKH